MPSHRPVRRSPSVRGAAWQPPDGAMDTVAARSTCWADRRQQGGDGHRQPRSRTDQRPRHGDRRWGRGRPTRVVPVAGDGAGHQAGTPHASSCCVAQNGAGLVADGVCRSCAGGPPSARGHGCRRPQPRPDGCCPCVVRGRLGRGAGPGRRREPGRRRATGADGEQRHHGTGRPGHVRGAGLRPRRARPRRRHGRHGPVDRPGRLLLGRPVHARADPGGTA